MASAILSDLKSGLAGMNSNPNISIDQIEDEIIEVRQSIIREMYTKGILQKHDLMLAINCIEVDCESLERCKCRAANPNDTIVAHFEIPQIVTYYGKQAIDYIGSTDRQNKFNIITSLSQLQNKKYKKRGNNKPYVWIDYAPNTNGMLDCFLFNGPFVNQVSIVAVFKDPRDLNKYNCCNTDELKGQDVNDSFVDQLIKDKLTKEKLYYYRQMATQRLPNDQQYVTGG